ncbi:aromatic ring hydroxylase [archaeon]|nr:MAG: aromatic ring hydroxylase [archaeon]RLG65649.1 MAG: aromatic ring hydroxylase [archaeon]HDM23396.1 metal-sulfur cluster assembly factor [Candidatus Bathyarchaeota archaeon]
MVDKDTVLEKLKEVYDPEIPFNIVDLGFIRDVVIDENGNVTVKMVLTSPFCPMMRYIIGNIKSKVREIKGVNEVNVVILDERWNPDMMSDEVKKKLGFTD